MKRLFIIIMILFLSCQGNPPVILITSEYQLIREDVLASYPHIIVDAEGKPEVVYLNEENRQAEFGFKKGDTWNTVKIASAYPIDDIGDFIFSSRETELFSAHDVERGAFILFERTLVGWTREVIDDTGDTGYGSKILEDIRGGFHFFYVNNSTMDLVHTSLIAGSKMTETIDPGYIGLTGGGKIMPYISAIMKDDGIPVVMYYEGYYGLLKTASMTEDGLWNIEVISSMEGGTYPFMLTSQLCNCLKVAYYDQQNRTLVYGEKHKEWISENPDASKFTLGISPVVIEKDGKTFVFYINRANFSLRVGVKDEDEWELHEMSILRVDGCPLLVSEFNVIESERFFRIVVTDRINREVGYVERSVDDF